MKHEDAKARNRSTIGIGRQAGSLRVFVSSCFVLLPVGCQSDGGAGPTRVVRVADDEPPRDTDLARRETADGATLLEAGKYAEAEGALRRATAADGRYGPAYNDLGAALYHQGKLSAAAEAFRAAAERMPHAADPLNGIGLTLEAGGRLDDAVNYYDRAAAIDPGNVEFLGNAARARVKRGDRTDEVRGLLAKLAANDPRPDWNAWARETLARLRPGRGAE